MNNSNKHFVFVSYELHPITPGGVGVYLHHAATDLLLAGHQVSILLDIPRSDFSTLLASSANLFPNSHLLGLYCASDFTQVHPISPSHFPDEAMYKSLLFSVALSHIHREHPVDICEFFDYCGPAYQSLMDRCLNPSSYPRRISIRLHSTTELIIDATHAPVNSARAVHFGLERASLQLADCIISPGREFFKQSVLPLYPFLEKKCIFHCPPPFSRLGTIDNSKARKKNILFIGRLSKVKGAELFVAAATELLRSQNTETFKGKFIVVGPEEHVTEGFTVNELLALIPEDLRDRFVFTGAKKHIEILELLNDALFVVFANKVESFCYAAHEVHKAGVAVILRDIPAFRDHFKDGEEALFFDGRSVDLCKQMLYLLNAETVRQTLAVNGRDWKPANSFCSTYIENLDMVQPFSAVEVNGRTTVIVLSEGDPQETTKTIRTLDSSCIIYVFAKPENSNLGCAFLGSKWTILHGADLTEKLSSVYSIPLTERLIILNSGQQLNSDFLKAAQNTFGAADSVSFITCAHEYSGILSIGIDNLLPESSLLCRRHPSLGVIHRTTPGDRLTDYIDDSSSQGEIIALLRSKSKGGIGAFTPIVGIAELQNVSNHLKYYHANNTLMQYTNLVSPSFIAACAADFEAPDATNSVLDLGLLGIDGPWSGLAQQTKINTFLTLVRPCSAVPGENPKACCVESISLDDRTSLSWREIERIGDWTLQKGYSDTLEGYLRGKSGWLSFQAPPSSTIRFRCGPTTGLVQVVRRGRSFLVDTHSESESSLSLSLDGTACSLTLAQHSFIKDAGSAPTKALSCPPLSAFLERTLKSRNGILAIHCLGSNEAASLLDGASFPLLSYSELGTISGRYPSFNITNALEQAALHGQISKLVLIGNHEHFLHLALYFSYHCKSLPIDILLPDSFQWDPAHETNDIYFRWKRSLQTLKSSKINVFASSDSVYGFFKSTVENCRPFLAMPFTDNTRFFESGRQSECPIFLLQGSVSTNVLPAMHATILANHGYRSKRPIYLERTSVQAWQVARDLGQAHLLTECDNIWDLITANEKPGVVLCLSPNNGIMHGTAAVLRSGKWFIGGKSDQSYHNDFYNNFFGITEWEDSLAIAHEIENLSDKSSFARAEEYARSASVHRNKYNEQLNTLFSL
jgi:glycosyltransferase involved in cell wall biosynthesis